MYYKGFSLFIAFTLIVAPIGPAASSRQSVQHLAAASAWQGTWLKMGSKDVFIADRSEWTSIEKAILDKLLSASSQKPAPTSKPSLPLNTYQKEKMTVSQPAKLAVWEKLFLSFALIYFPIPFLAASLGNMAVLYYAVVTVIILARLLLGVSLWPFIVGLGLGLLVSCSSADKKKGEEIPKTQSQSLADEYRDRIPKVKTYDGAMLLFSHLIYHLQLIKDQKFIKETMVPFLRNYLHHEDEKIRAVVCFLFELIGEPGDAAIPDLIALLDDPSQKVRCNALRALGFIGVPSIEPVLQYLHAAPLDKKEIAIVVFAGMAIHSNKETWKKLEPHFIKIVPTLVPFAQKKETSELTLFSLLWIGSRLSTKSPAFRPIVPLLPLLVKKVEYDQAVAKESKMPTNDKEESKEEREIKVLANLISRLDGHFPETIPFLLTLYEGEDSKLKKSAKKALIRMGKQTVEVCLEWAKNSHYFIRFLENFSVRFGEKERQERKKYQHLHSILSQIRDPEAVQSLLDAAHSSDRKVSLFALSVLGSAQQFSDKQIQSLFELFKKNDDLLNQYLRSVIISAGQPAVSFVMRDLANADGLVRARGMSMLSFMVRKIKLTPAQIKTILSFLDDKNETIIYGAANILFQLKDKTNLSLAKVKEVFSSKRPFKLETRSMIAKVLGDMGEKGIAILHDFLMHKNVSIQQAASSVLKEKKFVLTSKMVDICVAALKQEESIRPNIIIMLAKKELVQNQKVTQALLQTFRDAIKNKQEDTGDAVIVAFTKMGFRSDEAISLSFELAAACKSYSAYPLGKYFEIVYKEEWSAMKEYAQQFKELSFNEIYNLIERIQTTAFPFVVYFAQYKEATWMIDLLENSHLSKDPPGYYYEMLRETIQKKIFQKPANFEKMLTQFLMPVVVNEMAKYLLSTYKCTEKKRGEYVEQFIKLKNFDEIMRKINQMLFENPSNLNSEALEFLGYVGPKARPIIPGLLAVVEKGRKTYRQSAVRSIMQIDPKPNIHYLFAYLEGAEDEVRLYRKKALSLLQHKDLKEKLIEKMEKDEAYRKKTADQLLFLIGSRENFKAQAAKKLIVVLAPHMVKEIAQALRDQGDALIKELLFLTEMKPEAKKEFVTKLAKLFRNEDKMRYNLVLLMCLFKEEAIPYLIDHLTDRDDKIWIAASMALEKTGAIGMKEVDTIINKIKSTNDESIKNRTLPIFLILKNMPLAAKEKVVAFAFDLLKDKNMQVRALHILRDVKYANHLLPKKDLSRIADILIQHLRLGSTTYLTALSGMSQNPLLLAEKQKEMFEIAKNILSPAPGAKSSPDSYKKCAVEILGTMGIEKASAFDSKIKQQALECLRQYYFKEKKESALRKNTVAFFCALDQFPPKISQLLNHALLHDPDPDVRYNITGLVYELISKKNKERFKFYDAMLEAAFHDNHQSVRTNAKNVLLQDPENTLKYCFDRINKNRSSSLLFLMEKCMSTLDKKQWSQIWKGVDNKIKENYISKVVSLFFEMKQDFNSLMDFYDNQVKIMGPKESFRLIQELLNKFLEKIEFPLPGKKLSKKEEGQVLDKIRYALTIIDCLIRKIEDLKLVKKKSLAVYFRLLRHPPIPTPLGRTELFESTRNYLCSQILKHPEAALQESLHYLKKETKSNTYHAYVLKQDEMILTKLWFGGFQKETEKELQKVLNAKETNPALQHALFKIYFQILQRQHEQKTAITWSLKSLKQWVPQLLELYRLSKQQKRIYQDLEKWLNQSELREKVYPKTYELLALSLAKINQDQVIQKLIQHLQVDGYYGKERIKWKNTLEALRAIGGTPVIQALILKLNQDYMQWVNDPRMLYQDIDLIQTLLFLLKKETGNPASVEKMKVFLKEKIKEEKRYTVKQALLVAIIHLFPAKEAASVLTLQMKENEMLVVRVLINNNNQTLIETMKKELMQYALKTSTYVRYKIMQVLKRTKKDEDLIRFVFQILQEPGSYRYQHEKVQTRVMGVEILQEFKGKPVAGLNINEKLFEVFEKDSNPKVKGEVILALAKRNQKEWSLQKEKEVKRLFEQIGPYNYFTALKAIRILDDTKLSSYFIKKMMAWFKQGGSLRSSKGIRAVAQTLSQMKDKGAAAKALTELLNDIAPESDLYMIVFQNLVEVIQMQQYHDAELIEQWTMKLLQIEKEIKQIPKEAQDKQTPEVKKKLRFYKSVEQLYFKLKKKPVSKQTPPPAPSGLEPVSDEGPDEEMIELQETIREERMKPEQKMIVAPAVIQSIKQRLASGNKKESVQAIKELEEIVLASLQFSQNKRASDFKGLLGFLKKIESQFYSVRQMRNHLKEQVANQYRKQAKQEKKLILEYLSRLSETGKIEKEINLILEKYQKHQIIDLASLIHEIENKILSQYPKEFCQDPEIIQLIAGKIRSSFNQNKALPQTSFQLQDFASFDLAL